MNSGPSPEKGSGQDRFRQMIQGPGSVYSLPTKTKFPNPGNPFSSGDIAPSPVLGSGSYYSKKAPCVSAYLRLLISFKADPATYSSFQKDMYGESDPTHRVAVNPAIYPFIGMSSAMSSLVPQPPFFPMPQNGGYSSSSTTASNNVGGVDTGRIDANRSGNSAGGSHNSGSRDNNSPTWTSILSAECQRRRFNPQFTEWITSEGGYKTTVNLNGQVMHDSRVYSTACEAKQAMAKRAIDYVRTLKVPENSSIKATERAKTEQEIMNRGRGGRRPTPFKKGPEHPYSPAPITGPVPDSVKAKPEPRVHSIPEDVRAKREEDRRLLEKIQSLYGHSAGPNEVILGDPLAARAFLEGFALGGKLRESSRAVGGGQRRSRSPADRTRSYRDRSPDKFFKTSV
jgi:hypothetical protein